MKKIQFTKALILALSIIAFNGSNVQAMEDGDGEVLVERTSPTRKSSPDLLRLMRNTPGKSIIALITEEESLPLCIQMLKKLDWKESNIITGESCCFRSAVMWLNSLFSFYEFGLELEEKKKEPEVYKIW